jgi:hypothetical protein
MLWDLKSGHCLRLIQLQHVGGLGGLHIRDNVVVCGSGDKSVGAFKFEFMPYEEQ